MGPTVAFFNLCSQHAIFESQGNVDFGNVFNSYMKSSSISMVCSELESILKRMNMIDISSSKLHERIMILDPQLSIEQELLYIYDFLKYYGRRFFDSMNCLLASWKRGIEKKSKNENTSLNVFENKQTNSNGFILDSSCSSKLHKIGDLLPLSCGHNGNLTRSEKSMLLLHLNGN